MEVRGLDQRVAPALQLRPEPHASASPQLAAGVSPPAIVASMRRASHGCMRSASRPTAGRGSCCRRRGSARRRGGAAPRSPRRPDPATAPRATRTPSRPARARPERGDPVIALLGIVHQRDAGARVRRVYLAQHLKVAVGLAPGVELDRAEPALEQLADERDIGSASASSGVDAYAGSRSATRPAADTAGDGSAARRCPRGRCRAPSARPAAPLAPGPAARTRPPRAPGSAPITRGARWRSVSRIARSNLPWSTRAWRRRPRIPWSSNIRTIVQRAVLLIEIRRPAVPVDVGADRPHFDPLDHDLIIDHRRGRGVA